MAVHGGPEKKETAKFILLIDWFFHCVNVCTLEEDHNQKPDLMPFWSVKDPRFKVTVYC